MFLGVDGGGTKTAFIILSASAQVVASTTGGSSYHPGVGLEGVRAVLRDGIRDALAAGGLSASAIRHAFFGLPAYGEDPVADAELARAPGVALASGQYSCGNDVVCGWAGALACADGISVTAGTGSIAYGEYAGRQARCGGWGEVFGDEGSAHWIGREGLTAFSRMSDGRDPPGPLLDLVRRHFHLARDIDLAGRINDPASVERSAIAQLSRLVAAAARAGDAAARRTYTQAGAELASLAHATRARLAVPDSESLPVSYAGGVFNTGPLILEPFRAALMAGGGSFILQAPLLTPVVGAALYAARVVGLPFARGSVLSLAGVGV